ncbi:helix-turn-helix transcriptional regulator [Amycolatopsis sp. K13G38]|uniref:Helix-turn-helix transcriptional regulator n=1 Tax=Amycolatopsis acididurans TaxID=2724524 RepID=A0ABX1JCS7_9PSEU|nr:helix-turn-helix transcriptional regulator [Amycolatopsis acididurans]NKQ57585.1 helix-turn-helix transcriptional regulator [Amycolatopsis acididurans]
MEMADVMRQRRADLGMSQADLANAAGIGVRQIRRYEAGEQQPVLSVAVAIAQALKISVGELAGTSTGRLDLAGQWYAGWQTWRDGEEAIAVQEVRLAQRGDSIEVQTVTHGLAETGYHWTGEFRLWDNEVLLGWYAANDGSVRSKGTMYFVLHPHGTTMRGRWVGLGYDGKIMTGWGSMAREKDDANTVIDDLKASAHE